MLNKILACSVLSLALLMQPARAESQQSDKEDDSFMQALSTWFAETIHFQRPVEWCVSIHARRDVEEKCWSLQLISAV